MSALDAIMELNKRRQAERDSQMNALPNAINQFVAARQQAQQQQNQNLVTQLNAAKQGFRIENGQLVKDESLIDPITGLKQQYLQSQIGLKQAQQQDIANKNAQQEKLSQDPDMFQVGVGSSGRPIYRSKSGLQQENDIRRKAIVDNPSLDQDTVGAVAAYNFSQPRIERVLNAIDAAKWDDKSWKTFAEQIVVNKAGDIVVPNGSPLEDMMGAINDIRLTGFGLGGKNFTENEAKIVFGRLDPTGKSLSRYKKDIASLSDFFKAKIDARVGGMSGAKDTGGYSGQSMSADQLKIGGSFNGGTIKSVKRVK